MYQLDSDIKLMCLESPNGPQSAAATFDRLESKLLSLKGRKFYGFFRIVDGVEHYFAGVRIEDGDDPDSLGLVRITIKSGKYDRELIEDWEKYIDMIPSTFAAMVKRNNALHINCGIEYYRSQKELYLLLPLE